MPSPTKSELQTEIARLRSRPAKDDINLAQPATNGHASPGENGKASTAKPRTLQASEMRYRRLFESAKDGILILDAVTGHITDANPYVQELLGYSLGELLGKALWDIGPFRDIVASQEAFRELQSQNYIRYDNLPLETKAGQHRQVEFVSNVYLVDGHEVIQCNVRDITARKQAEDAILKANAELLLSVAELQRRDREMQSLNQMNDLLQSCTSQAEAYQVVALVADGIFAGQSGCLAILHTWDHYLEVVARWGDTAEMEPIFALEDCWAMRRGHLHAARELPAGLHCRHFVQPPAVGYMCVPLVVQGDTLGMLCLLGSARVETRPATQQLATMVGEAIKLSLSNLKLREKLREQAVRDPLTELFNRRHLEDSLVRELHRAQRSNSALCLAMLDLDDFKVFNDSYGHNAGDAILRGVSQLLCAHLRDSDIVCRYGGEEFVLVLPDSSLVATMERIEQIRVLVKALQIKHGSQLLGPVTISAGVAEAHAHALDARELLRAADEALYSAKRAGRDRVIAAEASTVTRPRAG